MHSIIKRNGSCLSVRTIHNAHIVTAKELMRELRWAGRPNSRATPQHWPQGVAMCHRRNRRKISGPDCSKYGSLQNTNYSRF